MRGIMLRQMGLSFNPYFSGCFSLSTIQEHIQTMEQCFNPYFSGCFSLSCRTTSTSNRPNWFQSLFFWMLLSKPVCACNRARVSTEFQSLFFWMLLSKILCRYVLCPTLPRFNPYFSGCFSLSQGLCPLEGSGVSILIFLDASL